MRRRALLRPLPLALTLSLGALWQPVLARTNGPARTQPVDMVVLHATGGPSCNDFDQPIWVRAGTFEGDVRATNAHPRLGVHWMIARDGRTAASVPESEIANHTAGFNRRSIGVQLVNDGDGLDPFPTPQIDALIGLLQGIVRRHPDVHRDGVVRHSDLDTDPLRCAPERRRHPGPGAAFAYPQVLDAVFGPATPTEPARSTLTDPPPPSRP